MAIATGIKRASVIPRMKRALELGKSAGAFLREMQAAGLGYRRTTFLADWRNVGNIEEKEHLIQFVRKDYLPSPKFYAEVDWKMSREYLYKVRMETRIYPEKKWEKRWVNIVSDRPMTPGELETQITESWGGWYPERREDIRRIVPETAIRRIG